MLEDLIILVDDNDQEIDYLPKLEAHQKGLLHRAFSVLIFNDNCELLIHQRALDKYHSPGLWTNTCCSHPKGESALEAANRRLMEEMGLRSDLRFAYKFKYHTVLENNLIEHELDHVFIGESNENPTPDNKEVIDYKWISLEDLKSDMNVNPSNYTFWFKLIVQEHLKDFSFNLTKTQHESL